MVVNNLLIRPICAGVALGGHPWFWWFVPLGWQLTSTHHTVGQSVPSPSSPSGPPRTYRIHLRMHHSQRSVGAEVVSKNKDATNGAMSNPEWFNERKLVLEIAVIQATRSNTKTMICWYNSVLSHQPVYWDDTELGRMKMKSHPHKFGAPHLKTWRKTHLCWRHKLMARGC